jgi:uncharacterized protein (TIGR01777 family)
VATILISGASGFIGSSLARALRRDGHQVAALVRGHRSAPPTQRVVRWDPERGDIDTTALAQLKPDGVVNLAGEPIAQRWTSQRRRRIRDSRINGTTALSRALANLGERPKVLVSGSAVGYYGAHRGDELLEESSDAGQDFLAETAESWEAATAPAADAGIRVAISRTGLVVGRGGGVLAPMMLPFRLGVGGRIASGRQWMSWIALEDMVRALRFLIDRDELRGPLNLVAPEPVRNTEFTKTLARVLRRPALIPVPAIAMEILFGTMADNTILASQRVVPKRLAGAGFEFRHPRLEEALRFELTRSVDPADR